MSPSVCRRSGRRRLGAVLKRLRGELGLSLDAVARRLEISPSKLSRLETGQVAPRIRDVRDLLDIDEAPVDVRVQTMTWAEQAKEPGWWQPFLPATNVGLDMYISPEADAAAIKMFSLPVAIDPCRVQEHGGPRTPTSRRPQVALAHTVHHLHSSNRSSRGAASELTTDQYAAPSGTVEQVTDEATTGALLPRRMHAATRPARPA